jgi:hypothetical protein
MMRPPNAKRRPGGGGAAVLIGNGNATKHSPPARPAQLLDELGHRLPVRRSPVVGAPRLAQPSWHRLAANRWQEVVR